MSETQLERRTFSDNSVSVTDDLSTTSAIYLERIASISVSKVSGNVASVTPYICGTQGGTYKLARDSDGNAVGAITLATTHFDQINLAIFDGAWLKLQGDDAGVVEWIGKS